MIIIGVDFHPEFQQIASVDTDTGEFQEKRLPHPEDAEKFYRRLRARRCESAWKPVGTPAGSNGWWQSCSLSCGSETRLKFRANEHASRRRIGKMRGTF